MTKAARLHEAWRGMPVVAPALFVDRGPMVILAPHPDDETLGLGGLMAAAAAAGRPPTAVILTNGAGSHPQSKTYGPERLVALRQAESAAAAACLGVPPDCLHHLGEPDTALPKTGADFDRLCDTVTAIIRGVSARTVLVTWDKDPHCDHEAAAAMAHVLRERDNTASFWSYPVWGWHIEADELVDAPLPDGFRIDIAAFQKAKRDAIAAHASQMTDLIPDDPDGFRFTAATLTPFLGPYEYVFRMI